MSAKPVDISAGAVAPSTLYYKVTYTHDHPSLKEGDLVVMTEYQGLNTLLRVSDFSLHTLDDGFGQYVHLTLEPVVKGVAQ